MSSETATAETLLAADREDRYGVSIPLRVDNVERTPDHGHWAQLVHGTDANGTHVKVTIFDDAEISDHDFDHDAWYEFSDVNPDVYGGTIGLTAKWDRQVTRLDGQPTTPSARTSNSVSRLSDLRQLAALDIETINTVDERTLEIGEPAHNEVLCVGLGYYDRSTDEVDTTVLFRDDGTERAERKLIEETLDWLENNEPEGLLTFNGAGYDLPMLVGRAERLEAELGAENLGKRVRERLESHPHADLSALKNRVLGEGQLEDMAAHIGSPPPKTLLNEYDLDLTPVDWRKGQWQVMQEDGQTPPSADLRDPVIYNSDIPHIGQHWLEASENGGEDRAAALFDCLEDYTAADIEPLFDIANSDHADGLPVFEMTY